jgi:hypothetical protein
LSQKYVFYAINKLFVFYLALLILYLHHEKDLSR